MIVTVKRVCSSCSNPYANRALELSRRTQPYSFRRKTLEPWGQSHTLLSFSFTVVAERPLEVLGRSPEASAALCVFLIQTCRGSVRPVRVAQYATTVPCSCSSCWRCAAIRQWRKKILERYLQRFLQILTPTFGLVESPLHRLRPLRMPSPQTRLSAAAESMPRTQTPDQQE